MSKRTRLIAVGTVLVIVAGGAYWRSTASDGKSGGTGGPGGPSGSGAPVPVIVAPVTQTDFPLRLEVIGRVQAAASVTVKPRVDGQVASVSFTEGAHVRAGDVLAQLDPAPLSAKMRAAQANHARDAAQLAKVRLDVQRYTEMREKGYVSQEAFETVRANADALAAAVRADAADLDLAKLNLGYATITAPIDGVIGERLVHPGAVVKTNDTPIAVINQVRPAQVAFAVPEKYLAQVKEGLAKGALSTTAMLPPSGIAAAAPSTATPPAPLTGAVSFLDNAVDPATGTIQLKADFANDDERLTPGQFVTLTLTLGTLPGALVVPAEAVQNGPQGQYVYVATPVNTAEIKLVTVAVMDRGQAVIASGLTVGEQVVTDGQLRLMPGAALDPKPRDGSPGS